MEDLQIQIQKLLEENRQLQAQNEERDRQIAELLQQTQLNAAKIHADRKNRKFADMAIYLILGLGAAFVIGYKRETDGNWSYSIAPELALGLFGGGGALVTLLRKDSE